MTVRLLVPADTAPSGWGVEQEDSYLFVLTPCCGARVPEEKEGYSCGKCGISYKEYAERLGWNLGYFCDLGNPHMYETYLDWMRAILGAPELTFEVLV